MTIKSLILAGATVLSLAAPAVALADPYWEHEGGYHQHWRDADDSRRGEWRGRGWREHESWEHRHYGSEYAPRCFIEHRGYYDGYGDYVSRRVRICR